MGSLARSNTTLNGGGYATYKQTSLTPELSKYMPDIPDHNVSNHLVRSTTNLNGNRKNYYNPARNQVYSRFSTADWNASNRSNFQLSEKERSVAERLRIEAFQTVKSTNDATRNRQDCNTKKLAVRVSDITFWKDELIKEINLIERETSNLEDHRRRLEQAFRDTDTPLKISQECMKRREKRTGIDLVNDEVERQLSKEVDLIKRCQKRMKKMLDKTAAQLRMNIAAQKACEADARDKHHSQDLDDRMYQLRNTSSRIGFYPGIENVDNTLSVPVTWMKFTQENINRSAREREVSERLRGEIDALMRACANEMWNHFNAVNNAFNSRIQETIQAKNALQAHLQRTNNEIRDLEHTVSLLEHAIADKEAPMKVAQTRLEERCKRINVELCNDPVMHGLQREVNELKEAIRVLKLKLKEAKLALNRMHKTRATLENDIAVKENSIAIDSTGCMNLRKSMTLDARNTGPIFNMPLIGS